MKHSVHARGAGRLQQTGVGLIEVLVAVLVVSIGFLGVAALQATSLSTNNSAMARSMATVSSYSILDALRLDRVNALAGNYDATHAADACPDAGDTLESVQWHLWCKQLGHNLGEADTTKGTIACTVTAAATATTPAEGYCAVTITFDDSRSGAGGTADQKVTTQVAL